MASVWQARGPDLLELPNAPEPEQELLVDEGQHAVEDVAAARFYNHLRAVPWGVLGLQLDEVAKRPGLRGPEPDAQTVIVDPAGLHYIQVHGPSMAGGASASIYKFLRIQNQPKFPSDVVSAVKEELQAKLHTYSNAKGDIKVIHAVGPDLRHHSYDHADEAIVCEALSCAYTCIFREFLASRCPRLRLLPISGGIFSGRFSEELPSLTVGALGAAFLHLSGRQQEDILACSIELCIYFESEFSTYADHLMRVQRALAHYLPAPPSRLCSPSSRGTAGTAAQRSLASPPSSPAVHGRVSVTLKHMSAALIEEETPQAQVGPDGAEAPLNEVEELFATEMQLGDRPGTGYSLLRTAAEGSGAPAARQPPPDITALTSMSLLKVRAKARASTRRGASPPRSGKVSRKKEELRPWDGWGSKATAEPEPEDDEDEHLSRIRFDVDWKAKTVRLSPDHTGASCNGSAYGGMVLSLEIVRKQVIGRYFELRIEDADSSLWKDGLGIGFAVKPKKEAISHLRNVSGQFEGYACELLPSSWILGYDGGRAKICGQIRYLTAAEMPRGLWHPKDLRSGDVLGLLATPDGHLMLFVNDELHVMAQSCEGLEKHWLKPLHAAVDLDGCTKTVRLLEANGMPSKKVTLAHAEFREAAHKAKYADDSGMQIDGAT